MSIALRVLPSKLELKRRDGSGILAPRANVSFTTFVYASPVQTIPWCDQAAEPLYERDRSGLRGAEAALACKAPLPRPDRAHREVADPGGPRWISRQSEPQRL